MSALLLLAWGEAAPTWAQTPGQLPPQSFSVEFESGAGYTPNIQSVTLPGSAIAIEYDAGTFTLSWPDHRSYFRTFWLKNTGPQHVDGIFWRVSDNHGGGGALWGGLDPGERVQVSYLFDWIRFFPANPCVECWDQIAGQQIPVTWTVTAFTCNTLNQNGTCGDSSFPSASVDQHFVVAAQSVAQRPLSSIVKGHVYDAVTGKDLTTALVEVMNPSGEMRLPPFNLSTCLTDGGGQCPDGIGRYKISVPAMTALIRCEAPGYQTLYQTATVALGATVTSDCAMTTMPWSASYSLVKKIETGTGLWGWAQTPNGQQVLLTSALTNTPAATLATSSYAWLVNLSDGSVAWKYFIGAQSAGPSVSPDGKQFAIPVEENLSGLTSALHVVDATTGTLVSMWVPSPYTNLAAAAYSPDGKYVVVGGFGGAIYLIDTTTYTKIWSKQLQAQVRAVAFSPDSQTIYATSDPSPIYALRLDGSVKWRSHTSLFAYAANLVQTSDGSRLVIKSKGGEYLVLDQNGQDVVREGAREGAGEVARIAPDGSYALQVTGSQNGAHLVDPTGKLYWWANVASEAAVLMSNPKIVLEGATMYDLGGTLLWTDPTATASGPHVAVITPDAQHILVAGEDGVIYVYSGKVCTPTLSATSVAVNPNGGAYTVNITVSAGCAWTATANDSFITVTSGAGGTGNATVQFTVAPNNSGSARTGTLNAAGWTVTVSQAFFTFADVPPTHPFVGWIEALYAAGITGGCSTTPPQYCPDASVTRGQMAVFLLRGIHGPGYDPPAATGTIFADVPASRPFAKWIEQLAREGITGGCSTSPPQYCPDAGVTRGQMAVFLLRSKHGAAYNPPAATGTIFTDVPGDHLFAKWIEQLAHEGITGGCSASPPQYCPDAEVTRGQMAVFLVRTFSLPM